MEPLVIISVLAGMIFLLLIIGAPITPIRFIGQGVIKILIGALFLFFLNSFGTLIGLHVPINFVTASISGFLGLPGVVVLAVIQFWVV